MRTVVIPEKTVTEDINLIEENPGIQVRFLVGQKEENGNWVVPQQFETFIVSGEQYVELNGPPLSWCPDKPVGTYRNEDLWHYVDMARG
jgi:hypothetical protein